MDRRTLLDRLEDYFEEIERIYEEERPLSLGQKCALIGLAAILVGFFTVLIVAAFQA